jgi:hypothetical protein
MVLHPTPRAVLGCRGKAGAPLPIGLGNKPRECYCADPENCKQAVPGYVCKAGHTVWQDDSQSDASVRP